MATSTQKNELKKPTADKSVEMFYREFNECYENLTRSEPFLDNTSPREYWDNCRARFNLLTDYAAGTKDWHSTYDTGMPRNKLLALFAHTVGQYMSPSILAQNQHQMVDRNVSMFLKDLTEHSLDREHWLVKRFWQVLTTMVEGTSVIEENYGVFTTTQKDITGMDFETGKATYSEIDTELWRGAYFELVPNDHFLVPNPYLRDIQEQDYIFRFYRMSEERFRTYFSMYEKASEVKAGVSTEWAQDSSYFARYDNLCQLKDNEIMVIKRYRKSDDTLTIIANGIELTEEGNPIPRPVTKKRAKRYPFVIEHAEPIDNDFYLGKSIVERLAKVADELNTLWRILIDREVLKNLPPIETTNEALVNEDLVVPGNVIHKGLEQDVTQVIPGLFQTMDAGITNLIQMLEKEADDNSVSQIMAGQQGSGGQPTATQTLAMAKNAQTMLNMFNELQRHSVAAMTELRMETLLWRLKIEKEFVDQVKLITVHDRVLRNGRKGDRVYVLEEGLTKKTSDQLDNISKDMKEAEKKLRDRVELAAVDIDGVLEMDLFVKVDGEPKPRRNDDLEKMMAMERFSFYSQRPDLFNLGPAADDVAMVLGDDPEEVVKKQEEAPPQPQQPQGSQAPQEGAEPQGGAPMASKGPSMKQVMGLPQQSNLASALGS